MLLGSPPLRLRVVQPQKNDSSTDLTSLGSMAPLSEELMEMLALDADVTS
jgi:hypothetical protein